MKRILIFLLVLFVYGFNASGQSRLLTAEEASGMNPKLSPANLSQLQWQPGTNRFVWVADNSLLQSSAEKSTTDTLVRLKDLNTLLVFKKLDTLKRFPAITLTSADRFTFFNGSSLFQVDIPANTVEKITSWNEKAENPDMDKTGRSVAFTLDNNLWVSRNGTETAITREENKGIVYGSSRVHRNEFGIGKGTFWSPDGRALAFYRMDETMVTDYPLVDVSQRIATVVPTKYPMAGMTSHKVTVGVYTLADGKTVYLQTDRSSVTDPAALIEYLTNVTWSPDGKSIYIAVLNREQNFMQLNRYDAATGQYEKTLFTETEKAYVEPLQGPKFLTGDPEKFIWESRRDGFNHLYLYDTDGNLIRQFTSGPWEVTDYLSADLSSGKVWFICNKDNPIGFQLCTAEIKTGKIANLTSAPGTHSIKVSDNGKYYLDIYSNHSVPRQVELSDNKGKVIRTLLSAPNPLAGIELGETSVFTLKNDEGTDLYCRMIKPVHFDPDKKYPVIIYVYGGPHSQLVTDSWLSGGGLFLNYLADLGYVVFTLDNRGTSNRGRDFEQAIFRNLGAREVEDQMTGVRHLKTLPFIDSTRIGINGWSYGGFMTISMFLKHPGTFKVAVCGGPVVDWKYYEVMYGERYMDTPETNQEGYGNACLTNYVKNLKGRLLIIHDDQDGTVVPQNSLTFLKKCVDERKQVDFFLYPGHEHNVRGKDRVHLNEKIVRYFQDYL